jgi:hypothetical protein
MEKIIKKKNSHGELIEIKLIKGVFWVKHSDAHAKFKTLNTFLKNTILSDQEVVMIYKACQELQLGLKNPSIKSILKKIFK